MKKNQGIYELIGLNNINLHDIVSKTAISNLDIIVSNDHQNQLDRLLADATGGKLRLINLLPNLKPYYDLIVIDTKGARSATLETAILGSDIAVSPLPPEMLAAREFSRGTIQLFSELIQAYALLGIKISKVKLFINRADFSSTDAQMILTN